MIDWQEVGNLHKSTLSNREISDKLNITISSVQRIVRNIIGIKNENEKESLYIWHKWAGFLISL